MRQTVLCYNLKGTKKGRKLGMIFSYLGFKVRHILPEEYHIPVGELAEGKTDAETKSEETDAKSHLQTRCLSYVRHRKRPSTKHYL